MCKKLTDFASGINVLDMEDAAEAVEQDFGQSRDELRCGHEDIHIIRPLGNHVERLEGQSEPIIREPFDLLPNLHPMISALSSQKAWKGNRRKFATTAARSN